MLCGRWRCVVVAQTRLGGGRIHSHANVRMVKGRRPDVRAGGVAYTQSRCSAEAMVHSDRLLVDRMDLFATGARTAGASTLTRTTTGARISAVKASMPRFSHDVAAPPLQIHGSSAPRTRWFSGDASLVQWPGRRPYRGAQLRRSPVSSYGHPAPAWSRQSLPERASKPCPLANRPETSSPGSSSFPPSGLPRRA